MPVAAPPLLIRDRLAQRYGIAPWAIDLSDPVIADEVGRLLAMFALEERMKKTPKLHGPHA